MAAIEEFCRALDLEEAGAQLSGLQADLACLRTELGPFLPLAARLGWLPKVGPDVANAPVLFDMAQALVDGGVANPLPYDRVQDECDIVIAIDVSGSRDPEADESLSSMGVLLQSFTVMSRNILVEKLKHQKPTVYIKPDIRNVKILEFYKAHDIFGQARPALARELLRSAERELQLPTPGRRCGELNRTNSTGTMIMFRIVEVRRPPRTTTAIGA